MSVWNPENIRDVAESVGLGGLADEVCQTMAQDVEFRLAQLLHHALISMREASRQIMTTQDVEQALKTLGFEPLYGYETVRPLRFGEASIGPGQPLFYVEDEEMDLEKLINSPLPKVPREASVTAHYTTLEGVQPSIPQNPTTAESRSQDLGPKGPGAHVSGLATTDDVTVRPLVKHVVSQELQLYFERVCAAILDRDNDDMRVAAFSSLKYDPGLHQLVPYFVQFIAEKVTHNLRDIFILMQMIHMTAAFTDNENLYLDPYAASIVPTVLTCIIGRRLGTADRPGAPYTLRTVASSLLGKISNKYSTVSPTLKPRLVRSFLKIFLEPNSTVGMHYGAIVGIMDVGGPDCVRALVLPNLKDFGDQLLVKDFTAEHIQDGPGGETANNDPDSNLKPESGMVIAAILRALQTLENDVDLARRGGAGQPLTNGHSTTGGQNGMGGEEIRQQLQEKLGVVIGSRVYNLGQQKVIAAVLSGGMPY